MCTRTRRTNFWAKQLSRAKAMMDDVPKVRSTPVSLMPDNAAKGRSKKGSRKRNHAVITADSPSAPATTKNASSPAPGVKAEQDFAHTAALKKAQEQVEATAAALAAKTRELEKMEETRLVEEKVKNEYKEKKKAKTEEQNKTKKC